jgi:hypothetical protein
MAELSIDPDYLRMLIVQVRDLMAKVPPELPDDGSNPTDDRAPPADLQDEEGDLTREEIVEEIRGLEHNFSSVALARKNKICGLGLA